MKIADFRNLIHEFPFKNQSFDISSKNWELKSQQSLINKIFESKEMQSQNGNKIITISRNDLMNSKSDIKEFIIKTLMWGYPTKGRGKNIENMLNGKNFEKLVQILNQYRESEITIEQLKGDINSIHGLGLSTITKFTHFLNTTINRNKAVILDNQIIEGINTGRFEELNHLKGISYTNALNSYSEYLKTINDVSKALSVEPDQVEMFLFTFGRSLSEIKLPNSL